MPNVYYYIRNINKKIAEAAELADIKLVDEKWTKYKGKVGLLMQFIVKAPKNPFTVIVFARYPSHAKGKPVNIRDTEILVRCSCPAWLYFGSDYHADKLKYLYGKPKHGGHPPNIRDPEGKNYVCKHVYAVLTTIYDIKIFPPTEQGLEDYNI